MSVITKDLGAVSAYGLALEAGFEGTEQEYAELLASYGTVAQEAGESAEEAEAAKTDAETAKDAAAQSATRAESARYDAALYTNQANGYKNTARDAMTAARSARDEAVSAKDTAVDAVDGFAAGAQQALDSVNEAGGNWKSLAEKQAGNSEAWAVGQRGGTDVPTTDATYHNNAKYYAEQAGSEKTSAQTARQGAETAATNASASATAAATSASQAAESARTLTIDPTLTKEGQAADAEAVGGLKTDLSQIVTHRELFDSDTDIETAGYYLTETGATRTSPAWDITKAFQFKKGMRYIYKGITNAGTSPVSCFYDATGIFLSYFKQQTGENVLEIPDGASSVKFSINTVDLQTFSITENTGVSIEEIVDEVDTTTQETNEHLEEIDVSIAPVVKDVIALPITGITILHNRLVTSDGSYYTTTSGESVEIDVSEYASVEFPVSAFINNYGYIWKDINGDFFGFKKTTSTEIVTVKVPDNAVALRTCWRKTDYPDTTGLFKVYRTMGAFAYDRTNYLWLNKIEGNISNSVWSWWTYPQVVLDQNVRKRAYFGEVNTIGIAGLGSVSTEDGKDGRKTNTIMVGQDDHNGMAIFRNHISLSGRYFLAFAFSHNVDQYIHCFVAKVGQNADYYNDPIEIGFPGKVSYAQVFSTEKSTTDYTLNRVFLVARVGNSAWYGILSDTYFGNSWNSAPQPIITADRQYYCMFRETTTAGVLRIVMYSNPNLTRTDTRIRMGFLHLDNGNIYNADNETLLGNMSTGGVSYKNFDIIIDIPNYDETKTQDDTNETRNRLLDVAITAPEDAYIAYAKFTNYSDGQYYVYYNGVTKTVVSTGDAFYRPSVYVGGLIFTPKNPNTIYLSRKESARSRLEKWVYSNGDYTFNSEIDRSDSDLTWCVRPIIDKDGTMVIYQKGSCNVNNFSQYNFDAKAYKVI